ncbi:uncharacterized protein K444DRAFT_634093 [Hyaloscypha bicolor E]|uniref:Uncharacterized protein n=1 Tax=Hyaloscypha bicolor E TaxID=1095630 RepID=A0A2J6SX67_9HELO|nr:uncharacterized protein K444DRAFT_634093 [Hyaloscypha bicolor E]PMD55253.1 hypothetical protein K444DRAFT_634093 [Hyaloscypha bicolor E]
MLQDVQEVQKAMAEYSTTKSGLLASNGSGNCFTSYAALAFQEEITTIKQSIISPDTPTRHLETAKGLLADALASPDHASLHIVYVAATVNIDAFPSQSSMLKPPESMKGKPGISFTIAAERPLSVGSCYILSSNPEDDPRLTRRTSRIPLMLRIELAEKMRTTSPFSEKIKQRIFPPESVELGKKKERLAYLKGAVTT